MLSTYVLSSHPGGVQIFKAAYGNHDNDSAW